MKDSFYKPISNKLEEKINKEGDYHLWRKHGFICMLLRHSGNWCGYVGVEKSHKLYGKGYSDKIKFDKRFLKKNIDIDKVGTLNLFCASMNKDEILKGGIIELSMLFDVHGGITFAREWYFWKLDKRWWFGFDTEHAGDLMVHKKGDEYFTYRDLTGETYRDKKYCIKETENLAGQLKALKFIK